MKGLEREGKSQDVRNERDEIGKCEKEMVRSGECWREMKKVRERDGEV